MTFTFTFPHMSFLRTEPGPFVVPDTPQVPRTFTELMRQGTFHTQGHTILALSMVYHTCLEWYALEHFSESHGHLSNVFFKKHGTAGFDFLI